MLFWPMRTGCCHSTVVKSEHQVDKVFYKRNEDSEKLDAYLVISDRYKCAMCNEFNDILDRVERFERLDRVPSDGYLYEIALMIVGKNI